MNKRKYIFQTKAFWLILSAGYLLLFMIKYVVVYFDINFDIPYHVYEPTYHLILRKLGIIQGGKFGKYKDSLDPILYDLPDFIVGILILTVMIVALSYLSQKIYRKFREHNA